MFSIDSTKVIDVFDPFVLLTQQVIALADQLVDTGDGRHLLVGDHIQPQHRTATQTEYCIGLGQKHGVTTSAPEIDGIIGLAEVFLETPSGTPSGIIKLLERIHGRGVFGQHPNHSAELNAPDRFDIPIAYSSSQSPPSSRARSRRRWPRRRSRKAQRSNRSSARPSAVLARSQP